MNIPNQKDEELTPQAQRQLNGLLLRLIYVNHNSQGRRTNSTLLRAVIQREGYDFTRDDVLTMLQDLKDRGYIRYQQMRDASSERLFLFQIEITASGRDLINGLTSDPAVQTD